RPLRRGAGRGLGMAVRTWLGARSTALVCIAALGGVLALAPTTAQAAGIDGATLGFLWGVPFIGLLLSIAVLPLAAPRIWHHHFGKITAAWAAAVIVPFLLSAGVGPTVALVVHTMLGEYIPFL